MSLITLTVSNFELKSVVNPIKLSVGFVLIFLKMYDSSRLVNFGGRPDLSNSFALVVNLVSPFMISLSCKHTFWRNTNQISYFFMSLRLIFKKANYLSSLSICYFFLPISAEKSESEISNNNTLTTKKCKKFK